MKTAIRLPLALLTCLVLCLCLTPAACADTGDFTLPANTTVIEDEAFYGCASMTSATIPAGVVRVGNKAFFGCTGLTSLMIPGSVTSIGSEAFSNCKSLKNVIIPEGVTSIGDYCFYACTALSSASIPEGVTVIGDCTFYNCGYLRSVTIPAGLKSIGYASFYNCSKLSGLVLPEGLTSIGSWSFFNCGSLTSLSIPNSVVSIGDRAFAYCSKITELVIPEGVAKISARTFQCCENLASVTIPATVRNIGDYAFQYCDRLKDVYYIGTEEQWSTVEKGGGNESLNSAKIHFIKDSQNVIASDTWGAVRWTLDCEGLLTISGNGEINDFDSSDSDAWHAYRSDIKAAIIGEGITRLGYYAFCGCENLAQVTIPRSVTQIGIAAFQECSSLTDITIPEGVESIEGYLFYGCGALTSVTLPESVTVIWNDAFRDCGSLTEIHIPASVTDIGGSAFWGCGSLKSVTIPEGVTSIKRAVFDRCTSLTSVVIPEGVTSIGYAAFFGCDSLTCVTIPASVTNIGGEAFQYCGSLSEVYFTGTEEEWHTITIASGNTALTRAVVYYADSPTWGSCGAYGDNLSWRLSRKGVLTIFGDGDMENYADSADAPWCQKALYIASVDIKSGVTSIGNYAFCDCKNLTSITIPEGVVKIGSCAFRYCEELSAVFIPEGVTHIGAECFLNCKSMGSIVVPESLTDIGEFAFTGCTGITSAGPRDSDCDYRFGWTYAIPAEAFNGCSALTDITIPESVASIGDAAFANCYNLESITIPENVTSIGNSVFSQCINLSSVTFPTGITSIGNWAFWNCGLTSVTIPEGVTSIGDYAFSKCLDLTSATLPESLQYIGEQAFGECEALLQVKAPKSVRSIGRSAFYDCVSLTGFTVPEGLSDISDYTFYGCSSLKNVDFQEGVTNIGYAAFYNCAELTEIALPQSVTSIGEHAFRKCDSLTSVTIPGSVTDIGSAAFYDCGNLRAVYYGGNANQWKAINIGAYNTPLTKARLYPNSAGPDSETAKTSFGVIQQGDGWAMRWQVNYTEQNGVVTDPELTIRMDGVDSGDSWKFTVSQTDSDRSPWLTATGIDKGAFTKITVRGTAQNPLHIVDHLFSGYTGVTDVILSHVEGVDTGAFENCSSLVHVNGFDSDLQTISQAAFKNDEKLTTVYGSELAVNLSSIGAEAFMDTSLMSFDFCDSVSKIGARAFYSAKLGSVTLGRSVKEIGTEAFAGNLGLTIYCYRDSEAQRYAEKENIACEVLYDYEEHLGFNGDIYKENGTLTDINFGWNYELFEKTAKVPCKELAIASLILSSDIYEWDYLDYALTYFGFEKIVPGNMTNYDDMNRVGYAIASTVQNIGGFNTNIIAVVCRGSANKTDWQSNILQQAQGFRYAANNVKEGLDSYIVNQNINTALPIKLLITGHSRGGAVANILGTIVQDIASDNNTFVYTFACPNTTTDADRFEYDNICNIVVDGDPVPWLPPMVDGDNKFGRTSCVKASVNDPVFTHTFESITGGVSPAAIDNNADCVTSYPGVIRHHAPAVYMACILEPCGTAAGDFGLSTELNQGTAYQVSTYSHYSGSGGGGGGSGW